MNTVNDSWTFNSYPQTTDSIISFEIKLLIFIFTFVNILTFQSFLVFIREKMTDIAQHRDIDIGISPRKEFFVHLQILLGNPSRRIAVFPSTSRVMYLYFHTWSSINFNLKLCESGVRLAKRPLSQAFPTSGILCIWCCLSSEIPMTASWERIARR